MTDSPLQLSIIIPALNEEQAIEATIQTVIQKVARELKTPCELILVNDGSSDRTGALMDNAVRKSEFPKITAIHNQKPYNIGGAFRQGVEKARGKYVMMVPGDNEESGQTLINVVKKLGVTDLIISYPTNAEIRSRSRQIISRSYVVILNILFGLKLHYLNGACLIRRDLLLQLPRWTPGFAFMSEILIELIKSGVSYEEVETRLQKREGGKAKALSLKNFLLVASTISKLIWRIYFTPSYRKPRL
ncbi:MAG: glycosyltransferase family 2 protein [Candidatus Liptonbacteria bacterium]|nr:glycosyltransferase family 2 protein [Candidatus Liptonbacteria bacterium]